MRPVKYERLLNGTLPLPCNSIALMVTVPVLESPVAAEDVVGHSAVIDTKYDKDFFIF